MQLRRSGQERRSRRSRGPKLSGLPLRLFVILVVAIFTVEGAIMYALHKKLLSHTAGMEILIDPLLLTLTVFPLLYFLSFRPLLRNMKKLKRMERRLKRKNTLLEEIINGVRDGIGIVDEDENIVFCNPSYARIFDDSLSTILGKNLRGFVEKDSYDMIRSETQKRRKGKLSVYEIPILTAKRKQKHIRVSTSPRFDQEGSYVGAFGAVQDITDQKRMESSLRDSEEKFKLIVEKANEAVITIDSSGKIVFWNGAAEEIFGYARDEMIGRKLDQIIPEHFRQSHTDGVMRFAETGESKIIGTTVEVQGLRKDNSEIPLELSLVNWKVGGEEFVSSVIRDITQRYEIERMKNEFVSTVTHELRTPLTSIRGSLDLLNRGSAGDLPHQAINLIEIAARNSERLKLLVDDILDVQRLESGKMEFHMAPLQLAPVVKQSLRDNESFGRQFDVEFVLDQVISDAEVNADENRLAQVMSNLLSNAAKFSPAGSPVKVSVARQNGSVRVAVEDCGPGVPEEFRDQVFQRFAQARPLLNAGKKGSGLGLSIAKSIVEQHGGKIGFDTVLEVGTTFYFELPEWKCSDDNDQ